jgi:hypothetical protein
VVASEESKRFAILCEILYPKDYQGLSEVSRSKASHIKYHLERSWGQLLFKIVAHQFLLKNALDISIKAFLTRIGLT